MKVLHVIPSISTRSGGPGQAIIPMCRSLKETGLDVLLATTNSDVDISPSRTPVVYWDVSTVVFPTHDNSFKFSRKMSTWLHENVSDFDIVHIHAVFNHACVSAAHACRKNNVPYVIRPLGTLDPWSMKQKRLRKQLFWRFTGNTMMRSAAAVHYTTAAEQNAVEQSLGLNHGIVVPLGVETNGDQLQADNALRTDYPYVLVMSRLHPKKGLDLLIDAFVNVVSDARFAHWRLVIAGDGPTEYVTMLRRKISTQNEKRILFTGWVDGQQKKTVLRNASLLALPSRQENFGLCVVEAWTFGIPVLISPEVNLASEMLGASAGWISDVNRPALEIALRDALSDEGERVKRGAAGKILSHSFAWPQIAARWKSVYSVLAAARLTHDKTMSVSRN